MNNSANPYSEGVSSSKKRLRKRLVSVLTIILVIAIVISIQIVFGRHPERLYNLGNYVYGGAFLVSLIGNATIIFPGAVLVILANIGIVIYPVTGPLGPLIVGVAGAVGAAIGELTGYMVGYSGRGFVENIRFYPRLALWVGRWGILPVFLLSIVPFVFDVVGIIAGALRLPLWKFVLACWMGRTILYTAIVLAAALGYQNILPFFN